MIKLKTQHPYIDFNGKERMNLIKTYAEDENGQIYHIIQNETNAKYSEAVDVYPCKFTYSTTNEVVEINEE